LGQASFPMCSDSLDDMIKRAEIEDAGALAAPAAQMRKGHSPDELAEEFRELIKNDDGGYERDGETVKKL